MMTGLAPVGRFIAGLPALLTMVDSLAAAPCNQHHRVLLWSTSLDNHPQPVVSDAVVLTSDCMEATARS